MSSIRRKKSTGVYFCDLVIDGKRRRMSLHTKDRRTALVAALQLKKKLSLEPQTEPISLYRFLDLYTAHSRTRGKSPYTLNNERSIIKVFKSLVRDQPLDKFDARKADQFFSDLESRPLATDENGSVVLKPISAHGKNYYLRTLRMIWSIGVRWNMAAKNVFDAVSKFPTTIEPVRVLGEAELEKIFTSVRKLYPLEEDLVRFYLVTGMRRKEALNLEWSEVDFVRGTIMVRKAKHRKFREIPMVLKAQEILLRRRALVRPFADMPAGDTVTHHFKAVLRDAGVPDAKLHDTRKTFGTELARLNVNPYTIIKWLGHTNDKVTLDHYIGIDHASAERIALIGSTPGASAVDVSDAHVISEERVENDPA